MNADEERAVVIMLFAVVICVAIALSGIALGDPPLRTVTPPQDARAPITTELRIVVWPQGPDGVRTERLLRCPGATCPPSRILALITNPERRGACTARRSGGRAEAMIEGRIQGRYVARFIEQRDPCTPWRALAPLVRTM